jgi:Tat protein secretion system quality control protein TatD with DNase activity
MGTIDNEIQTLEEELIKKRELKELIELTGGNEVIQKLSEKIEVLNNKKMDIYMNRNTIDTTESLDKEIKILEEQIVNLLSEEKRLAIFIHSRTCHNNHTDSCSWGYEIKNGLHNWQGYAHKTALNKAEKALTITDYNTIIRLLAEGIF